MVTHDLALQARILQLLFALEQQGGTPISTLDFHAFAYLANVLSPLWSIEPIDDAILKDPTRPGPYYPRVQRELELLVGRGLVVVRELLDAKNITDFSLRATFGLSRAKALPVLRQLRELPDESDTSRFLEELATSFLDISRDKRDDAAALDAAFSDPAIPPNRVVAFGAEVGRVPSNNASWNVANALQRYAGEGVTLTSAEKLAMYVRLLKRRANG